MRYVCFILALLILASLAIPVLADDEEPAPEPEELQEPAEYPSFDFYEPMDEGDSAGEEQSEDLFLELYRVRACLTLIFWGVIFLCGVILGCFSGVTLIRMWGA